MSFITSKSKNRELNGIIDSYCAKANPADLIPISSNKVINAINTVDFDFNLNFIYPLRQSILFAKFSLVKSNLSDTTAQIAFFPISNHKSQLSGWDDTFFLVCENVPSFG